MQRCMVGGPFRACRPVTALPRAARVRCRVLRKGETPQQAFDRRTKESSEVESRVVLIETLQDFEQRLTQADNRLIVLEVQADDICQLDPNEEPDLHWKADREARLEKCLLLKHTFQRTARNCPDVEFLELRVECTPSTNTAALLDRLGVSTYPTLQFWRNGNKLWQHEGATALETDLGEGVLYYSDQAQAGTPLAELHSKTEFNAFVNDPNAPKLSVIDISLTSAAPCVHVFPAVVALSRSFQGTTAFARLIGDESPEATALLKELGVVEVPTFLFFSGGKEVGRHVGSSRGDLIGKLLEQLSAMGIQPPPPPKRVKQQVVRRRR